MGTIKLTVYISRYSLLFMYSGCLSPDRLYPYGKNSTDVCQVFDICFAQMNEETKRNVMRWKRLIGKTEWQGGFDFNVA